MSVITSSSVVENRGEPDVWEVASGIDSLYMSGRVKAPNSVLDRLQTAREVANEADEPVGIEFGGVDFEIAPYKFGRYKYRLEHAFGLVGISPGKSLPTVRVQPWSEFLHRAGVEEVVRFYRRVIEREMGSVELGAARLDLYIDTQGWTPGVDERRRFVSRASSVGGFEDNDEFNGLTFGKRKTNIVYARIYDKTIEIRKKKDYFVEQVWGDRYVRSLPVVRTEFQIGRDGLVAYGIDTVEEAIRNAPGLWAGLTNDWLSLREVGTDSNRSRWVVAPEWKAIQSASLASGAVGLKRMAKDHKSADLMSLLPGLTGYVSSVAAIKGGNSISETLAQCEGLIRAYSNISDIAFESRVATKRGKRSFTIPEDLQ